MPLSSHQKIRLQQLQVPRWELRSSKQNIAVEQLTEQLTADSKQLQQLTLVAAAGEQPAVFFWSNDSKLCTENFINDLLIGTKQQNTGWQHLSGDKVLFDEFLTSVDRPFIAIFISQQFAAVDFNVTPANKQPKGVSLYLPASPENLVVFKKQLWGAIYQTCYL
jgi:hypothetical protein